MSGEKTDVAKEVVKTTEKNTEAVTDKENYKTATMTVQGNAKYKQQYTTNGSIQIKLRGNLSSLFPQKPYKIKLDKKTDMFGMGKNKHWVLLSNFLDECCMRNLTASNLAKQFNIAQMDMEWVTVIFNGKYAGNYIFEEHIRIFFHDFL